MNEEQKRNEIIQGMRDWADWLQAHPAAKHIDCNVWIFDHGEHSPAEVASITKAMGSVEKQYSGPDMFVRKMIGGVLLTYCVQRATVCERVVVGTKTIPSQYIPEHEEELVEWKCGSILEQGAK